MTMNESDKNRGETNVNRNYLKERAKRFAPNIIKLVEKLPEEDPWLAGLAAGTSAGGQ